MDISKLTAEQLKQALTLLEKRQQLADQIATLDREFDRLTAGGTASTNNSTRRTVVRIAGRTSSRRGAVKAAILRALRSAGKEGARVTELSASLGLKNGNVHTWFNTTGRKIAGLRKIGPARYRLEAA